MTSPISGHLVAQRIGFGVPGSDDDLRSEVIRRAKKHDITLKPEQIAVERTGTSQMPTARLMVKYKQRISLLGLSFVLRFKTANKF
jgi:hypothetical protein